MRFAEKIRELTSEKSITVADMARELNLPYTKVNSWFLGKRTANKKELKLLADYSGWSLAYWSSEDVLDRYKRIRNLMYIVTICIVSVLFIFSICLEIYVKQVGIDHEKDYFTIDSVEYKLLTTSHGEYMCVVSYQGTEETLTIPSEITIKHGAFRRSYPVVEMDLAKLLSNESLKHLEIPESVEIILFNFGWQDSPTFMLETVTVDSKNKVYDSRMNCNAIIHSDSETLIFGTKNCTIPPGILAIDNYAFFGLDKDTVVIPEGVQAIYDHSFEGSTIKSIKLPSTLETISWKAFWECNNLNSILIPKACVVDIDNVFPNSTKIFMECAEEEYPQYNVNQYFYSESAPTGQGKYWHYNAEGNIEVWN